MTEAKQFGENNEGVHLMHGEFAVCGDAFDVDIFDETATRMEPTKKRVVTCERCIAVIELCRGARTA